MNQRLFTLFFGLLSLTFLSWPATAGPASSVEANFTEGIECLQRPDIVCAKVALQKIPPQQIYAKILEGAIAAAENDTDKTFRLLLPIQVSGAADDPSLLPQAAASLHASLALAYDQQSDPLRSLQQRIQAGYYWQMAGQGNQARIEQNQTRIWHGLAALEKTQLIEMRGESLSTSIQGWIDLALSTREQNDLRQAVADWRKVYPDHGASTDLVLGLAGASAPTAALQKNPEQTPNKVALLLPFASAAFHPATDAIERGFMAARNAAGDETDIAIYPTDGDKEAIDNIYQQAVNDGAGFIVGPLTRDEVTALSVSRSAAGKLEVPTLALNQAESSFTLGNLYSLGLSVDTEAAQIARLTRDFGLQTAIVIAADTPVASRMAQSFGDAWQAEGGRLLLQVIINGQTIPEDLQSRLQTQPADLLVLATEPELARSVRAFLDITTPTYGFSHIYTGVNYEPEDAALLAVRFIDLPWMLASADGSFDIYKEAAADLPQGMMQRWFALGADAYQVFAALAARPDMPLSIRGLTGRIEITPDGGIRRTLALGQFTNDGVVLEQAP
ncbi:MAG: putative lipoprotein-like protein [Pseudomonadota bacterium]|jgi:outer membrane PBP1 activator LpoA protein